MAVFALFVFKNVFTLLKTYIPLQDQRLIYKCFQKRGGMVFCLSPYPPQKVKTRDYPFGIIEEKCFQKRENKSENILLFGGLNDSS